MSRSLLLTLLLLPLSLPAAGATVVYKCTGSDGRVTFQDKPCARTQRQDTIELTDPSPTAAPPARATTEERSAAPVSPPAPPPEPAAPLPRLYACTRATDGKAYVSQNGYPEPYLAPFGVLGAVQLPLARVYGPGGGGGISAPEANRGKVTAGMVSGSYVWVQDQCRPLSFDETCHALQDDYDDNARKLRRAFKSDRPPLEQRDETLRAQLTNCR